MFKQNVRGKERKMCIMQFFHPVVTPRRESLLYKKFTVVLLLTPMMVSADLSMRVTFGKNGGTGGDDYVTATYGQPMPTPRTAPIKTGWTFGGYWDTINADASGKPLGKQYYDANMQSVRNWDKTTAVTLWAKWTVRVSFGKNGGTGGDDYVTVTYNQSFPTRTMPTRPGFSFGGYWVSASSHTGQCYNTDGTGTASMKWTTGGTPTIWALWTATDELAAWLAEQGLSEDSRAANGRTAADCYVLGLDPAEATNDFRIVSIELVDGKPKVEWEPKTNRWTGAEIQGVLKGAETLDGEWQTVTEGNKAGFRFFKVVVP